MKTSIEEQLTTLINQYSNDTFVTIKSSIGWRIKVDGEFITTKSGKSLWKQIGHAKSALRFHFEAWERKARKYAMNAGLSYTDSWDITDTIYVKWVEEHVEFIQLTGCERLM